MDNGFWKVCAALDNPIRIELLCYLLAIEKDAFPCVVEIAETFHLAVSTTSAYLKKLADAGLVTSKRTEKRIYYRAFPTTPDGQAVVDAYRAFFATNPTDERLQALARFVAALSHYRRHAIVRCLHATPGMDLKAICRATDMPDATADRLLGQLGKAHVVDVTLKVIPPRTEPEATLLRLSLD